MAGADVWVAEFEAERGRLRRLAYGMLGSVAEAEDAVQDAWLRLERAEAAQVRNLTAWLHTVVSRLCLDRLRARKAHAEEPVGLAVAALDGEPGPEQEVELLDSVGRALLVVLDRLGPAERVAFVLHDLFALPFEQIAPIVDRSPVAAKKLASRARQRVRGNPVVPPAEVAEQRRVVEAFLAAARGGRLDALLELLAPDVVRRAEPAVLPAGAPVVLRGAEAVARATAVLGRRGGFAAAALVDGRVGVVVAPHGRLLLVLLVSVAGGRVTGYEVVADPARIAALELAALC
ncbi:sigma-70 family RNA polymerase sigma factor [Kitasatospora sp. NPDC006697]|uniref:sigma-70 family RNA polymerase sigma factor n=1 Tax=Kitasatospora sp. NPDC006697 TaxID=3364020 RepID=UPI003686C483